MRPSSSALRQRGIGFFGLVIVVALVLMVLIVGMKVVPSLLEYQAVQKAVQRASGEATVAGIRADFDRAAAIDNITSISGRDLTITKVGDRNVVAYDYRREFPLVGPALLTMHYRGESR